MVKGSRLEKWVASTHNELYPSIITQGFLKRCILNNLDGRKDDILWKECMRHQTRIIYICYHCTDNYDLEPLIIDELHSSENDCEFEK